MSSAYSQQFNEKLSRLTTLLAPFGGITPTPFESPEDNYRQRVEFTMWHESEHIQYAMFTPGTKQLYCIEDFPAAAQEIRTLMPSLLESLNGDAELRTRLFSVEFLATLAGEMLVTLIYHRPIGEPWLQSAKTLQAKYGFKLIGRSRKQKICLGDDFVVEEVDVGERQYRFQQVEGSFTQPNARINQKMIGWVLSQAGQNPQSDLLELYCGSGNFSIPLASCFREVFATEISKSSMRALDWNIGENRIDNLRYARLSAEEMSDALTGVRPFRRLAEIELTRYQFSHILVDPPRAGLDAKSTAFVQGFDQIIYISCNPETLAENLAELSQTHELRAAAIFDQFPFTPHIESGVYLKKRPVI